MGYELRVLVFAFNFDILDLVFGQNLFKVFIWNLVVMSDVLGPISGRQHPLVFILFATVKAIGMDSTEVQDSKVQFDL